MIQERVIYDSEGGKIVIRAARVEEAPPLLEFYEQLLAEELPHIMANPVPTIEEQRDFVAGLQGDNGVLLAAWHGGVVAGNCMARVAPHPQHRHVAKLGVSVARAYRGRGIGTALLEAVVHWARDRGLRRIEFEMIQGNPAKTLYDRLGFEVEGVRRRAHRVGDELLHVVLYAMLLEE